MDCQVWGGLESKDLASLLQEFIPVEARSHTPCNVVMRIITTALPEGLPEPQTLHDMEDWNRTPVKGMAVLIVEREKKAVLKFIPRAKFRSELKPLLDRARRIFCFKKEELYSLLRASPSEINRINPDGESKQAVESKNPLLAPDLATAFSVPLSFIGRLVVTREDSESITTSARPPLPEENEWLTHCELNQLFTADDLKALQKENAERATSDATCQQRFDSLAPHFAKHGAASYNTKDTPEEIAQYMSTKRLFATPEYTYKCVKDGYFTEQEMIYWRFKTNGLDKDLDFLADTTLDDLLNLNVKEIAAVQDPSSNKGVFTWKSMYATEFSASAVAAKEIMAGAQTLYLTSSCGDCSDMEALWYVAKLADLCVNIYTHQIPISHQKKHFSRKTGSFEILDMISIVKLARSGIALISHPNPVATSKKKHRAGDEKDEKE
jgi:hypothetical protein